MIYFKKKKNFAYHLTNSKQIDELLKNQYQKIIFTDYKNFKVYQKNF